MKSFVTTNSILLVLFLSTACNFNEQRTTAFAETKPEEVKLTSPNLVTIKTADFVFLKVPDTIPSGMNTFRVENQGVFPHNAAIALLTADHTYDEMIEYVENSGGEFPEWAALYGRAFSTFIG